MGHHKDKWNLKGSFTVEMSVIVPVILMIMYLTVLTIFYEYDKSIINAAAYETAVVGSTKARQKEKVDAAILQALFYERISGRCLLVDDPQVHISISDREIKVQGEATFKYMNISVEQTAVITKPEQYIRKKRR